MRFGFTETAERFLSRGHHRVDPRVFQSGEQAGGERSLAADRAMAHPGSADHAFVNRDIVEVAETILHGLERGEEFRSPLACLFS
jgi:hypothetical protein